MLRLGRMFVYVYTYVFLSRPFLVIDWYLLCFAFELPFVSSL